MKNNFLEDLDILSKKYRSFLFLKYKEYFEKTDGYCKENEMKTNINIIFQNGEEELNIELLYENYFNILDINVLQDEIPKINISGLNQIIYDLFLGLKNLNYLNEKGVNSFEESLEKISFSKDDSKKIMNLLGYNNEEIIEKEKEFLKNEKYEFELDLEISKELNFDFLDKSKNIIFDEKSIINKFYEEEIFSFVLKELFIIELKDQKDLNLKNIFGEINKKNKIINDILKVLGFYYDVNFLNQELILNDNDVKIKNIESTFCSYVFGPIRKNVFSGVEINELSEKIEVSFNNDWDFNIE